MRTITLSAAVILVVGVASSGLVVDASARPVGRRVTPAMNLPVPASLSTTALDDPTIAAIFDAAKKLGIKLTPPADDQGARDHAAAMQSLRGLEGKAFDKDSSSMR